jgi:ADP-heptose:LPS heptosyltransferase
VGDFILTLPAIRLLRESIPDCELEVLGYPKVAELAITAGYADRVRSLEHRSMALLFVPNARLEEELATWLKSFHLIVSYLFDPDGILRENMQQLGVKTYLDMPQRITDGHGYAANQLAKPLEKIAFFLNDQAPRITHPQAEPRVPNRIAIHPGSGGVKKNWPVANWCQLGPALAEQYELALITGEAEWERGTTQAVLTAWQGLPLQHWDGLPLPELAKRLSSCSAFLGHDSGISHLAAACGVPCHLFFGPSDAETWAPRNAKVLQLSDLTTLGYREALVHIFNFLSR